MLPAEKQARSDLLPAGINVPALLLFLSFFFIYNSAISSEFLFANLDAKMMFADCNFCLGPMQISQGYVIKNCRCFLDC